MSTAAAEAASGPSMFDIISHANAATTSAVASNIPPSKRAEEQQVADQQQPPKKKARKVIISVTASQGPQPQLGVLTDAPKKPSNRKPSKKVHSVDVSNVPSGTAQEELTQSKRHAAGYTILRIERDKIARTLAHLIKRKASRETVGKVPPTVCSMLNDMLIRFYERTSADFDREFANYIK
jgi:hypothetical protein